MDKRLQPGLTFEFQFRVPESKTVPFLYPESSEFQVMPKVLATGFMVGLFEWACIRATIPYLDWPDEQTVGTDVKLSHLAPTPPGLTVTVKGTLDKVEGRKLVFSLAGHDGLDVISRGTHERHVIDAAQFNEKVEAKTQNIQVFAKVLAKLSSFPPFIRSLPEADLPFRGLVGWLLETWHGQVLFNESRVETVVEEHSHGDQWGIVVDGRIDLTVGGETLSCNRGDTYFIPNGTLHKAHIFSGFRAVDYFADRDRYRPH